MKIRVMCKTLVSLFLLLVVNTALSATLTSRIDRNPIKINQTLTLIVQYDDQVNSSDLDLTELSNDFEILANIPNTNSSVSIINGQTTRQSTTTWRITLAAKREGKLQIPALSINGDTSDPIDLEVASLSAEELAAPQPIEVTLTIDDAENLSIKPGEQVLISLELSAAANVGNLRGEELSIEGVDIELLDQQNGQRLENGVARQVAIWRYAIFPSSSGQIDIPAQTFTGTIGGRSSFFDSFISGGQQVGGRSIAQSISVDPQPDTEGRNWFPAKNVTIIPSWSGDINQVRVGEPITRSITIMAEGQRATTIPPLRDLTQTNYKSYKDQPQLETNNSDQGVTGTRVESEAIVPSTSGELVLPEQRISWWDINADQWRETILPEERINVLAAAPGSLPTQNTAQSATNSSGSNILSNNPNMAPISTSKSNWLWKIATLLLALICALQFYLMRKPTRISTNPSEVVNSGRLSEKITWNQLLQDLTTGNERAIRKQILIWARSALPQHAIESLDSVAQLSNSSELRVELNKLDKSIYSDGEAADLELLSKTLSDVRQEFININNKRNLNRKGLAPLYPT
ncbi:MAG: BatD family protein [Acidiferrobacterales bacterium]|nr:BatD family protein [Acidiferrobacterales bacterium]